MLLDVDVIQRGEADPQWCEREAEQVISRPDFSLLSLVEELGPVLTSVTTSTRQVGVSLLSSVLAQPGVLSSMSEQEMAVLAMFYTDRLRDHHSLLPATLQGLAKVTTSSSLSVEQLERVLSSLQTEVMVQQQVVRDRALVYSMLAALLQDKLDQVKSLATLFTLTLCQAAEGETDPRNLLVIFSLKAQLLQWLGASPVTHHREEIVESLAVYFPVDFTPPSGVTGAVTKPQLVTALQTALAQPSLAKWVLPLALEKLDSDLESAKVDSLQLLLELLKTGQEEEDVLEACREEVEAVWQGLKQEVLGIRVSAGSRVVGLAGEVVTEVSRLLWCTGGVWAAEWRELWAKWWRLVWTDCRPGLDQPRTSLLSSASLVLRCVSQAGPHQCEVVLSHVLPLLGVKASLTKAELELVESLLLTASSLAVGVQGEVQDWLDRVFTLLLSLVSSQQADRSTAALALTTSASLLSDKQLGELKEVLLAEVTEDRAGVSQALAQLLRTKRSLVETEMLPLVLELDNKSSLDCLYQCLRAGGVYRLVLTSVVENIRSKGEQSRVELITKLAQYDPVKEDFDSIEDKAADLLVILLLDVSPSWPVSHKDDLCKMLSDLGSALTVSSWQSVEAAVTTGDVSEYSCSVMGSLRPEIVESWSEALTRQVLGQGRPESWRLVASVVNKWPAAAQAVPDCPPAVAEVCLGLTRRGDGSGGRWLARLLDLLDQEGEQGEAAALVVPRLLQPHWWRHAVTGLLYKQRLWHQLLPALTDKTGPHHTAALVSCFPHLPPALLSSSLPGVMPRVISALSSDSTSHPALVCLDTISRQSPELVSSHQTELVHHCLSLASRAPHLTSRLLALSVLSHCASLQGATTVQLASTVTRSLRTVVSDRKRLVRLEAAKTRNKWYLVTQPS